jgi:phospholipid/cholesterol/gamma-HCH transport system substrate-binding protein
METKAHYTAVGAFVVALTAALTFFVVWLAKTQFNEELQPYHIMVSGSVTGLAEGSAVRYRGVAVGVVDDIRINPDNVEQVRVTIMVPKETPIKTDAIASLEPVGVTGGVYVEISGGTQEASLLRTSVSGIPVIRSRPSTIATVLSQAPIVLERVMKTADRISLLLNEKNLAATEELLANMAKASAGASESIRSANALLIDLRRQTEALGRQSQQLLATTNVTVDRVGRDAAIISGEMAKTSREVSRLSAQLAGMIEENRQPIRDFTSTGLYDLSQLLIQLQDLTSNLSRVSRRLERDPTDLLFGGQQGVKPE